MDQEFDVIGLNPLSEQTIVITGASSGHERGTHERQLMPRGRLYAKATKRPALISAAMLAGGALAWGLLRRRDKESVALPPQAGDMAQFAPEADPSEPELVEA
jgi:hypothetical protein